MPRNTPLPLTPALRAVASIAVIALAGIGVVTVSPHASAASDSVAVKIVEKVTNDYRVSKGKSPLKVRVDMSAVSQKWSERMRADANMKHNPNFSTQLPKGWTRAAENVGYACRFGGIEANTKVVMQALLKSPGHERNIRGSYGHLGIGLAYNKTTDCVWITQNFGYYGFYEWVNPPTPTITGVAKAGQTLSARVGIWTPKAALSYRWYRDGKVISGATSKSYRVKSSDRGHQITFKVSAKRSGFKSTSRTSTSVRVS